MDTLLQTLQGEGQLQPGSRVLELGFDNHTPIEMMNILAEDDEAFSIALHEITHFRTLDNLPGAVLTLHGLVTWMLAGVMQSQIANAGENDDSITSAFLGRRSEYVRMLETWRPLLEGMAVAVQLLPPCPDSDDLVPAHSDLWSLELTLAALDGGGRRSRSCSEEIALHRV